MELWLHYLGTACFVQELRLNHFPFVIGRRKNCDGHLPFAFISRTHCQFICTNNQVMIRDLESHNGTFVNGRRVSQAVPVKDGDEITLGPISFRLSQPRKGQETTEMEMPATRPDLAKLFV